MNTPLYKMYLFRRSARFYDLAPQAFDELRQKINAKRKALGVRDLFNARMGWSNEKYHAFGVEFFPSLESAQAYTDCLIELGYFQYVESETFLGIPMDNNYPDFAPVPLEAGTSAVFRAYLSRWTEYAHQLSKDKINEAYARITESCQQAGIRTLLSAYMRWNNETYEYFGIERFPSMESLIAYSQMLSETGWYRLVESRSYLGTAYGGLISGIEQE